MKRARFTETQIVAILKEADSGVPVKDVCRKYEISDATYYNWKSKYGGMEASDLKKMKELERELNQLKRMYDDSVYTAWGAESECIHRAVQSHLPGRGFEPVSV
jgi:putative transposase